METTSKEQKRSWCNQIQTHGFEVSVLYRRPFKIKLSVIQLCDATARRKENLWIQGVLFCFLHS